MKFFMYEKYGYFKSSLIYHSYIIPWAGGPLLLYGEKWGKKNYILLNTFDEVLCFIKCNKTRISLYIICTINYFPSACVEAIIARGHPGILHH